MFCLECGKEISNTANVCPYCGRPQREGVQLPQAQQYQQPAQVQQPQPYQQPAQVQQPQAQPYQQPAQAQVQQPQAQQYQQPVQQQPQTQQYQQPNQVMQQASGFMDRLTGGDFMKNYKITTLVAAGLNVLLLLMFFMPIFKLDASSTVSGLPGLEFSFPDLFTLTAKQQNADGVDAGMNFFMVVFAIISVITIVLPLVKKDFAKTRNFIFSKICAVLYGGLVIMQLSDTNSQLSKNAFTSSISLGLNFWGVLYMISAIGVIVATILMTMQMKKNNSFVSGGF